MRSAGFRGPFLVGGLLVVMATLAGASGAVPPTASPGEENPVCTHYERSSLSQETVAALLSRDADTVDINATRDNYRDRCGHPPTDDLITLTAFDQTWGAPGVSDDVTEWNTNELSRVTETDDDRVIEPSGATTGGTPWIRTAHTTIFGIDRMTRLHRNASTTRAYVSPTGTVSAVADYRHGGDTFIDSGRVRIYRDIGRSTVTAMCLLDGDFSDAHGTGANLCERDAVLDRTTGKTGTLDYDLSEYSGEQRTLSVATVVEYQGVQTRDECTDWNESRTVCDGEYERTRSRESGDLTTVDTREVTVYGEPNVTVQPIEYPSGDEAVLITTEQPIASLSIGDTTVQWPWRFYTATSGEWLRVTDHDGDYDNRRPSTVRPVNVYAYPSTQGIESTGTASLTVRERRPPDSSPATRIPDSVAVDTVTDTYASPTEVSIEGLPAGATDDITVVGIVDGTNRTLGDDAIADRKVVRETALETTIVRENDSHAVVAVELTDTNGEPVATRDRPGSVTVGGQQLQTNESGMATVTVRRAGVLTATYEPGSWIVVEQPYAGSYSTVQFRPNGDLIALLWAFLKFVVLLTPLWVLLYALDRVGGGRTWPPWQVFRF